MTHDTGTEQGRTERLYEIVKDYTKRHNWPAITRLIGGNPRYDLQDYSDYDAGEEPKGAQWV